MAAGPPPDPYRPCAILSIASPSPKARPGPNRGGAETMWGRISFLLTASAVAFGVAGCQAVPTIPLSAADVPEARAWRAVATEQDRRSEEHTSELQSLMRISYAVFCLQKKT